MSTVMYCWRIKKGAFWKAMHDLKQDALDNHPAMLEASYLRKRLLKKDPKFNSHNAQIEYLDIMKDVYQADESGILALQMFDEGRTWLIRPLYYGMSFELSINRNNIPFKEVYYDSRVGEGTRDGKAKADWVDDRISSGEYLIHVVLGTNEPFRAIVYNLWPTGFTHTQAAGPNAATA